jgi:hypothetical protein
MPLSPQNTTERIQEISRLLSFLSMGDQVELLELLNSTSRQSEKRNIIERVLVGERVWEQKKAG